MLQTPAERRECHPSMSAKISGRSWITTERGRLPSGHSGWLSDQVIDVAPPDGPWLYDLRGQTISIERRRSPSGQINCP